MQHTSLIECPMPAIVLSNAAFTVKANTILRIIIYPLEFLLCLTLILRMYKRLHCQLQLRQNRTIQTIDIRHLEHLYHLNI